MEAEADLDGDEGEVEADAPGEGATGGVNADGDVLVDAQGLGVEERNDVVAIVGDYRVFTVRSVIDKPGAVQLKRLQFPVTP
jgi:hypothetical protein